MTPDQTTPAGTLAALVSTLYEFLPSNPRVWQELLAFVGSLNLEGQVSQAVLAREDLLNIVRAGQDGFDDVAKWKEKYQKEFPPAGSEPYPRGL
jgi:hypothetical protein